MTRILPESLYQQVVEALDEIADIMAFSPEGAHDALDECRRAARAALSSLQALQVAAPGEPVYWECRSYDTEAGRWGEWGRVTGHERYPLEVRLADLREQIAKGRRWELRALYATPLHREPASSAEGEREAFEAACKRAHGPRWRGIMRALDPMVAAWEVWQARSPSAPAGEPTDTQRLDWLAENLGAWTGHALWIRTGWEDRTRVAEGSDLRACVDAALSAGSQKQDGGQG
jgi:hypothetical protein